MKTNTDNTSPTAGHSFTDFVQAMGLDLEMSTSSPVESAGTTSHSQHAANRASFPEGGRNTSLMSLAGTMRSRGFEKNAIAAALREHNQTHCHPPLDEGEVESIAHSVTRYAPQTTLEPGSLTDVGNAERFAQQWADTLRYVPEWQRWIIWDGTRWLRDETNQVMEHAKAHVQGMYVCAALLSDTSQRESLVKHVGKSLQLQRLNALIKLAESVPSLIARAADLDRNPLLLGVANGVVDLRTARLRKARPEDLMTRQAPVVFHPDAECPRFVAFTRRVLGGDQELVDYFQRVVGYGLTGKTTEQCLFFLYGSGANGKSTMLNVLKAVLGDDYARQTPSETLMATKYGKTASNDVARLQGARLVLSNEVEEGSRLSESLIKQLTGGDPISARYLYAEYFEFIPQFKILIAGNHHPVIRGEDWGIWRRLHLVPFTVTIPPEERDPELQNKLLRELPGILSWAIEGCHQWRKQGLKPPPVVVDAVEEYRKEMDILGQWIEEYCAQAPEARATAKAAYESYKDWAKVYGHYALSGNAFGRRLGERFTRKRINGVWHYHGLKIKVRGFGQ